MNRFDVFLKQGGIPPIFASWFEIDREAGLAKFFVDMESGDRDLRAVVAISEIKSIQWTASLEKGERA